MKIEIHNTCTDFMSYRAARVKSLFNVESGANFDLSANIDIDDAGWKLGVIVGPSGSGKTSIGRSLWGGGYIAGAEWAGDIPIIDAVQPGGDFDAVTAAFSAVGLGSVPTWLRPYPALSNGEKFRADLARIICESPERVIVDEFSSVVDRQIAKFGALAFGKAWKRTGGKCVLLSCHYDIIEWLEPDWVFDTGTGRFSRGALWRRPKFDLEIFQTDGSYWPMFEPHHYLKLPRMVAAKYYVGTVDGEPVAHVAVAPSLEISGVRACRLVIMPEWQGAGIGTRFLNAVCAHHVDGFGEWGERVKAAYFHTSHPGLVQALRRDKKWIQVSAKLYGVDKKNSAKTLLKSRLNKGMGGGIGTGYGGHFRAVQGFKYIGEKNAA